MCPSEPKPRYEVHSITGYSINPAKTGASQTGNAQQSTSYAVLDTLYCYREVATFYKSPGRGGTSDATRRRRAEELCARLNAEDQADAA